MPSDDSQDASAGIMRRAASYEAKYCEKDTDGQPLRITVPILNVGVHPQNRGGVYTQGQRCKELLVQVMVDGFEIEEAISNGVAVRERPPTAPAARTTAPAATGEQPAAAAEGQNTAPAAEYETFSQYNIRMSTGDKLLHGAYDERDVVSYASLAHSHLLNASRAILRRLPWDVEFDSTLAISTCDAAGQLSVTALAAHPNGKEWKRFLDTGMTFKVLSSAMDTEEPGAAAIISSARNKSHARSMQEHEWTALRLLNGIVIVDNSELATQELYRQYVLKVREALGSDAMERPITTHLIEFVIQLQGTQLVGELTEWASKMINSNQRKATYKLYKAANLLPKHASFSKLALIIKHYSHKPDEDKFVPDPNKAWPHVQESYLTQLEVLLRYLKQDDAKAIATAFRQRCTAPADENKLDQQVQLFITQLITTIVEKFEEVALKTVWGMNVNTVQSELVGAARVLLNKNEIVPFLPTPPPGCEWLNFNSAPAADSKAKAKPKGRPKGKPKATPGQGATQMPRTMEAALSDTAPADVSTINVNLSRQAVPAGADDSETYKLPWREWRRSEHFTTQGQVESLMAAGLVAARELHLKIDTASLPIDIFRVNGKYKVVATEDIPKGSLLIPPSVSQKSKFVEKTPNPHATAVIVEYEMQTPIGQIAPSTMTVAAHAPRIAPMHVPHQRCNPHRPRRLPHQRRTHSRHNPIRQRMVPHQRRTRSRHNPTRQRPTPHQRKLRTLPRHPPCRSLARATS